MIARAVLFALTLLLAGCDLESLLADPKVAQREADSKAIGSACRYGMRGIEDCYTMNEKASKAAVFTGWKEMDQYMRDNKIDGVPSKEAKTEPTAAVASGEEVVSESPKAGKEATKASKKAAEGKAKPAGDKAEAPAH
ncbi:hypothetical protein [Rhodoferax lacus]|uniref:hypothetical protein n=1 Tax=Rhodoferax lacus TaxID=2184758 RepID=UPI0018F5A80A|nr:hypothetical protein [Rhodoferax lacus]